LTVLCGVPSDDSQSYPYQGKVEAVDVPVNPATGTAQWRAALANKDGTLLPGMAARLRLATSSPYKALLIPSRALDSYQGREFVYVVTKKDGAQVVDRRPVRVGRPHEGLRVIEEGLTREDRVVVSNLLGLSPGLSRGFGLQSRRGSGWQPGMQVKVEEAPPPAAPPPPQAKPK
jgi:membrane fusion protein, multidrug efflux system